MCIARRLPDICRGPAPPSRCRSRHPPRYYGRCRGRIEPWLTSFDKSWRLAVRRARVGPQLSRAVLLRRPGLLGPGSGSGTGLELGLDGNPNTDPNNKPDPNPDPDPNPKPKPNPNANPNLSGDHERPAAAAASLQREPSWVAGLIVGSISVCRPGSGLISSRWFGI